MKIINSKKEPATAATVTSPENEKILNESISPVNENVKRMKWGEENA
ncbi:MAG TPA: hypothetical protein PKI60_08075 [Oscillospiraceae bacterium]|nr:hypothetical protein [Oscillospiraceae bacterium]